MRHSLLCRADARRLDSRFRGNDEMGKIASHPFHRHPRAGGDPGDRERMSVFETGLTVLARYKNAEA